MRSIEARLLSLSTLNEGTRRSVQFSLKCDGVAADQDRPRLGQPDQDRLMPRRMARCGKERHAAVAEHVEVALELGHGMLGLEARAAALARPLIFGLLHQQHGVGKQLDKHHALRARGERLDDVAAEADAAVGDDRHAVPRASARDVGDRGELRHADARDDPRRADRARARCPPSRASAPGVDQVARPLGRRDVARDDVDRRGAPSCSARPSRSRCGVPVRRVDHEDVHAAPSTSACTRASSATPTAAPTRSRPRGSRLLSGKRASLSMSLIVMSPCRRPASSTRSSFSTFAAAQDLRAPSSRSVSGGAVTRSSFVITSLTAVAVLDELQVAARQDARPTFVAVDRRSGCPRSGAPPSARAPRAIGASGGSVTGSAMTPFTLRLTLSTSRDLRLDRQVLVDDPDAALLRQRDREPALRHRVHRAPRGSGCSARRAREACVRRRPSRGHDVAAPRHEEDVVERQRVAEDAVLHALSFPLRPRPRPGCTAKKKRGRRPPRSAAWREAAESTPVAGRRGNSSRADPRSATARAQSSSRSAAAAASRTTASGRRRSSDGGGGAGGGGAAAGRTGVMSRARSRSTTAVRATSVRRSRVSRDASTVPPGGAASLARRPAASATRPRHAAVGVVAAAPRRSRAGRTGARRSASSASAAREREARTDGSPAR